MDFEERYYKQSPVWWYTREIFLYRMLNQALRILDMEGMMKMGFFIRHLHLQLAELYEKQSNDLQNTFIVFRGQGFTEEDFQNLCESKGGLLSFNNFLSTSRNREVSMEFVQRAMKKNNDYIGVLFIIIVDPKNISPAETPFAFVGNDTDM